MVGNSNRAVIFTVLLIEAQANVSLRTYVRVSHLGCVRHTAQSCTSELVWFCRLIKDL